MVFGHAPQIEERYNVLCDIKAMLDDLEIDALKFEGVYLDSQNRQRHMYNAHPVSLAHAAQLVAFPRPSVTTSASFEGCLNSRCRNPVGG